MDAFQIMEIKRYFRLDKRISRVEARIKDLEYEFHNQSFYPQSIELGDDLVNMAFNIEMNVVPFVDTIEDLKRCIDRLNDKKLHFDRYLNSLPPIEKEYLVNKYKHGLHDSEVKRIDEALHNEIMEIEEMINFKFGYPVEIKKNIYQKCNSVLGNVKNMAAALGV